MRTSNCEVKPEEARATWAFWRLKPQVCYTAHWAIRVRTFRQKYMSVMLTLLNSVESHLLIGGGVDHDILLLAICCDDTCWQWIGWNVESNLTFIPCIYMHFSQCIFWLTSQYETEACPAFLWMWLTKGFFWKLLTQAFRHRHTRNALFSLHGLKKKAGMTSALCVE